MQGAELGFRRTQQDKKRWVRLEPRGNTSTTGASRERQLQLKDCMNPEKGEMTFHLPFPQIERWVDSTPAPELTPLVPVAFAVYNGEQSHAQELPCSDVRGWESYPRLTKSWLCLCVHAKPAGFLTCSGSIARILEGRIMYMSLPQLLTLTPVLGDGFYCWAFPPLILAQVEWEGGEVPIIYFHFSYFCSVFWSEMISYSHQIGTKFSLSPTPLQSLSLQSRRHYIKKKVVSVPTNCDRILFQNYSVGFPCMKLSAIFWKTHYSSQTSLERNPLKGHMMGRKCTGWEQKAQVFPCLPLTGSVYNRITWCPIPSLSLTRWTLQALGQYLQSSASRSCCWASLRWMGPRELARGDLV